MRLRYLRFLTAIAEHGTMTHAARSVGVSQPTLSENIQRLENELGTRLLNRNTRGVSLTTAGELVLSAAKPVLSRLDALPQQLQELKEGLSGRFVLGCYHSLGAWYLPRVFSRLIQELPDIDLQVHTARSADVQQAVLDRSCDLGLIINAAPHPDLVITVVSNDLITFVGNTSRLNHHVNNRIEILKEGPLFYPDQPPFTTLVEQLDAENLLPPRCVALRDLEIIKSIVADGVGCGVLPLRVARCGRGGLSPIGDSLPCVHDIVHMVMRYDTPRVRALRALRALLAEVGGAHSVDSPLHALDISDLNIA
ncbi:MAG: LysR family transcriptional regulator [Myxococcota bacterium]